MYEVSFSIVNLFNLLISNLNLSIDIESPISEIVLFKKPPPVCEYTNEKERNANTIRIFLKTLDLNN